MEATLRAEPDGWRDRRFSLGFARQSVCTRPYAGSVSSGGRYRFDRRTLLLPAYGEDFRRCGLTDD
jgi:hypothetical protein